MRCSAENLVCFNLMKIIYFSFFIKIISFLVEDTLNKFNKEYNLNELIISDCEEYLKKIADIDSKNKARGVKIDNIAQYVSII